LRKEVGEREEREERKEREEREKEGDGAGGRKLAVWMETKRQKNFGKTKSERGRGRGKTGGRE
jgi:hypothetical protein